MREQPLSTDLGKTKNDQPQEPKPKRASRARRSEPVVEAGTVVHNPALYAEMSRPYATREEADAALAAFMTGVRALRIKHRIADAVAVACVSIADTGPAVTWGQNGNSAMASPLLAYALGASEQADRAHIETMRKRGAGDPA